MNTIQSFQMCQQCGGAVFPPGVSYAWAGKVCMCGRLAKLSFEETSVTIPRSEYDRLKALEAAQPVAQQEPVAWAVKDDDLGMWGLHR